MATHVGKEGSVYVGANQVAEVVSFELVETADVEATEDTALGDEWKTFKSGSDVEKQWSGSIVCHWDETDTNGQEAMTNAASVTLNLYVEGNSSGDTYYTGTAIINEIGVSVTNNRAITGRTFAFIGSGALSQTTV